MSSRCNSGFHTWSGCKCTVCGKTRDEQHDRSKDCGKCSKCGMIFIKAHTLSGSKCTVCEKTIVVDKDGNEYKTVTIGTQEWTAENLNIEHYCNGDPISLVQDASEWKNLNTGACCYYDNKTSNGKIYGKLYNWYAVNDSRGLAPEGWHVPSDEEWTQLIDYLGGEKAAGGKLKATTLWKSLSTGATNSSEFTAFSGGYRFSIGDFNDVGKYGYFWSASEFNGTLAWFRYLSYVNSGVLRGYGFKKNGLSIRCVKD
ncbi:MAG: fibrobacter succinogenes major paralogous domain-containing protein [Ignavibacteriae bacterium]|nr:fibrobacter succinogenes major paralogous domain-containing protein [Ignavibacteriota bacterium]